MIPMYKNLQERLDEATKKKITATKQWKGKKVLLFNCSHCNKQVTLHVSIEEFKNSSCPHCQKLLVKLKNSDNHKGGFL